MRQECRNGRSSPSAVASSPPPAVGAIAQDRVADRAQVHADLVRPAGPRRRLEQRRARRAVPAPRRPSRPRGPRCGRRRSGRRGGRAARRRRTTSCSTRPRTRARYRRSTSWRRIIARERPVRLVGLRDDHEPRRAGIETVHDAGTQRAARRATSGMPIAEQAVHERAAAPLLGGVRDQACRLRDRPAGARPRSGPAPAAPSASSGVLGDGCRPRRARRRAGGTTSSAPRRRRARDPPRWRAARRPAGAREPRATTASSRPGSATNVSALIDDRPVGGLGARSGDRRGTSRPPASRPPITIARVGDVEHRPDLQVDEVDHVPVKRSPRVRRSVRLPSAPAEHEPERERGERGSCGGTPSTTISTETTTRRRREEPGRVLPEAERAAGVRREPEGEHPGDDLDRVARAVAARPRPS